jgi:hypothetical protein
MRAIIVCHHIFIQIFRTYIILSSIRVIHPSPCVGAVAGAGIGVAAGSGALFGGLVGMSSGILLSATVTNVINKPKN